jgi:hypothetical protein
MGCYLKGKQAGRDLCQSGQVWGAESQRLVPCLRGQGNPRQECQGILRVLSAEFFPSTQPGDALVTNIPGNVQIKLTFKNDELDSKDANLGSK